MELSLKLDPEGRTIPEDDSSQPQSNSQPETSQIDYSSKTVLTCLAEESPNPLFQNDKPQRIKFLDDILFDCEITDCALLPRTFWMPATGMKPRCALEQCALEVFQHHVHAKNAIYDPSTSGAEWWVQIRPSPPAGRYTILAKDDKVEGDKNNNANETDEEMDLETDGINFHWDKDEDLRLMMGGNMYIHPHISTVTYLSNSGAPTMALNYRVNTFNGEFMSPSNNNTVDAYVSWPKTGKHLSFDGRYLHAAPSNLMQKGEFEKQIKVSDEIKDSDEKKKQTRRQRRVTFLVNVWLNYKPFNVELFPETMLDKMTKTRDDVPSILFDSSCDGNGNANENDSDNKGQVAVQTHVHDTNFGGNASFKWKMGGCESTEFIYMELPLQSIRDEMPRGGNVQLKWPSTMGGGIHTTSHQGVDLVKEENEKTKPKEEETCRQEVTATSTEKQELKQENKRQKVQ